MLWESGERYTALVESIQIGITVHDALGGIVFANSKACEVLGMQAGELLGKSPFDTHCPGFAQDGTPMAVAPGPVATAISTGQPVRDAVVGIDKSWPAARQWLMVNADPQRTADGSVEQVNVTFQDITQRRDAEIQAATGRDLLRESALHTQAVLDNMVDAVITVNSKGLMESFNKAAGPMFGHASDEVIGQHVTLLIPEPRRSRAEGNMQHWQDIGEAHIVGKPREMVARRKGGVLFPISLAISRFSRQGQTIYVGLVRDITERTRVAAEMQANARKLEKLSRRVLEVQETERRRVARELHDELGQSLTAIKVNLQSSARFKNCSALELQEENLHLVEDAIQQVRRLALALRPSVLDDLGLVPALRDMTEQTARRSGFAVYFHPALPLGRLSPDVETACFRIVQEALTNVARYANAKRVDIDLFHDGDELLLSVTDDGDGFDYAEVHARETAPTSMGLLGMQERATLIGGTLEIVSAVNHGCTVRLRCPVARPTEGH
jgi:PAS domain S-box-containing protein